MKLRKFFKTSKTPENPVNCGKLRKLAKLRKTPKFRKLRKTKKKFRKSFGKVSEGLGSLAGRSFGKTENTTSVAFERKRRGEVRCKLFLRSQVWGIIYKASVLSGMVTKGCFHKAFALQPLALKRSGTNRATRTRLHGLVGSVCKFRV